MSVIILLARRACRKVPNVISYLWKAGVERLVAHPICSFLPDIMYINHRPESGINIFQSSHLQARLYKTTYW